MSEPEVALVLSPDQWFDDFHRHCTDHGGAWVRQVVVDPTLALVDEYDVLVVSHRWPALTRGFVADVHERGRRVLGVVDAGDAAAAEHLAAIGVDDTVASDGGPAAIVDALRALAPMALKPTTAAVTSSGSPAREDAATMVVVGGAEGSGATEVSIAVACAISTRVRPLVLLDADASGPSIAMRLAITSERNLRTAIDAVEHGLGELDDALTTVDGVRVLAGLPNVACWDQVRSGEMRRLLERVRSSVRVVVADVGGALERLEVDGRGRFEIARSTVATASELVAVVAPSPIGVMRGVRWITAARELAPEAGVHVVVNRAPADPFIRGEITDALVRAVDPRGVNILPADRRVERAAWDGAFVEPGPFLRAAAELAERLVPVSMPARARRSRRSMTVAAWSQ